MYFIVNGKNFEILFFILFYFILFSLLMGCYGFLDHTKFILYDKKYSLECEVQVVYIIRIILAFL